jgi:hypothetical protein
MEYQLPTAWLRLRTSEGPGGLGNDQQQQNLTMKYFTFKGAYGMLSSLLLAVGTDSVLGGTGYLEGKLEAIPNGSTIAIRTMVEVLNTTNAMLVTSAVINEDTSFELKLPPGDYRLCFRFAPSSGGFDERRSFYNAEAEKPSIVCFSKGSVVSVAAEATTTIHALVGYNLDAVSVVTTKVKINGQVLANATAQPLPDITVELLDPCSANVMSSVSTDLEGWFYFGPSIPGTEWIMRFSDPFGRYATSFHGSEAFDTAKLMSSNATVIQQLQLMPQHIEVTPLVADFGSVQLPGSVTTVVTIQNIGGDDLVVSSLAPAAGSSPSISIQSAPALPLTLAADESCEVTLGFKPTVLGPVAATLAVTSNDPDAPTVQVAVSGVGVASEAPPAEQIAVTLEFIAETAAAGTLQGTGPAGAADAHLLALLNQIKAASDLAAAGKLKQACQQLENVLQRTDGDPQPPDFVTGPAAEELRLLIELTRVAIGCD